MKNNAIKGMAASTDLAALAMLSMRPAFGQPLASTPPDVKAVIAGADARNDVVMRMQLAKPYPPNGYIHYQAFAAVRVVNGGATWEPDTVEQHHGRNGSPAKGMWQICSDEFSPVIIEVARKSDFPDFAGFQQSILANPLTWKNQQLEYHSGFYQTSLTFFTDYSKPPLVDGVPLNYAPQKVYDSPFIQGDFGSGVVAIRKGDRKLVLDFTKE